MGGTVYNVNLEIELHLQTYAMALIARRSRFHLYMASVRLHTMAVKTMKSLRDVTVTLCMRSQIFSGLL
jgi:hypothetical protein